MNGWQGALTQELENIAKGDLWRDLHVFESAGRSLERQGRSWINLASNDYLGLSQHPRLQQAASSATATYGLGAGASRLVTGSLDLHARVEQDFADFKHAQAALLFPTGYMANLAVLTSLAGSGDRIYLDKLCHASLIDAARLTGATVRVFPHRQANKLRHLLDKASHHKTTSDPHRRGHTSASARQHPLHTARPARALIVTESVFSMDGDTADLPGLCDLAQQYGAILVVDEAHATGVLGATGAGLCQQQGVSDRVDVAVSTASKALGVMGGLVTARREVIQLLINRARSFMYTTAMAPPLVAAIGAALALVRDEPWRRDRLQRLCRRFGQGLKSIGWSHRLPLDLEADVPIFPLIVGEPQAAVELSDHLSRHGFYAPAIRPPTVARGSARVRISLRADLEENEIDRLLEALSTNGGPRNDTFRAFLIQP